MKPRGNSARWEPGCSIWSWRGCSVGLGREGTSSENIAGDVLASITTMQWNGPAKGWNAGAPMDDANLNRRQTIRVGASAAYAQVGVIGFDGLIDLQSLRLYGLPEAAPAALNGTPLLTGALFGSGRREFAAEVSWDLPSLAPGVTSLLDVTVNGARAGDLAQSRQAHAGDLRPVRLRLRFTSRGRRPAPPGWRRDHI